MKLMSDDIIMKEYMVLLETDQVSGNITYDKCHNDDRMGKILFVYDCVYVAVITALSIDDLISQWTMHDVSFFVIVIVLFIFYFVVLNFYSILFDVYC